jgi:outer membrane lipoprotein carrier protein
MTPWRAASVAAFALAGVSAQASGLAELKSFLAQTKSGRASFTQVVAGKGPRAAQESTGTFSFLRPGRFRWSYAKPFEQLIVGDGSKLWIYDRDLNQVVVRKLDVALGSSPAALLAGDNALEKFFNLVDAGRSDGLELVDATPKTADTGFERVRIGFKDSLPRVMELKDAFGNVTTLTFGAFERNHVVDAAAFRFEPPPGADVIGEDR